MKLTITLKPGPRVAAYAALQARGMEPQEPWFGPTFEGWLSWGKDIIPGFLVIKTFENEFDSANYKPPISMYAYPMQDIARLKFE